MKNTFKLEIPNLAKLQKAFHAYPSIAGPEFKKGINVVLANIMKRATDEDGRALGTGDENPLLDMRQYVVEYIDGVSDSERAESSVVAV